MQFLDRRKRGQFADGLAVEPPQGIGKDHEGLGLAGGGEDHGDRREVVAVPHKQPPKAAVLLAPAGRDEARAQLCEQVPEGIGAQQRRLRKAPRVGPAESPGELHRPLEGRMVGRGPQPQQPPQTRGLVEGPTPGAVKHPSGKLVARDDLAQGHLEREGRGRCPVPKRRSELVVLDRVVDNAAAVVYPRTEDLPMPISTIQSDPVAVAAAAVAIAKSALAQATARAQTAAAASQAAMTAAYASKQASDAAGSSDPLTASRAAAKAKADQAAYDEALQAETKAIAERELAQMRLAKVQAKLDALRGAPQAKAHPLSSEKASMPEPAGGSTVAAIGILCLLAIGAWITVSVVTEPKHR